MKKGLTAIVAASSLVLVLAVVLGLPRSALAQTPLTISTTGLTCTNGVCDLGTFWDLVAGQFPPGLSLDRSGLLSGTPTTTGTFTFTVQVTDKAGTQATGGPFSITVS